MTRNFAHRGFSGKYPENTMLAFQKGIEAGCGGIELDVHLSRDGVITVIHDEDITRTSNGRGKVRDMTFEELRGFDASAGFGGEHGVNPIPSLEEYFELVKDLPIVTNIELKNGVFYYNGLEEKTIEMVRKYHLEDRIIFSSFNNASIAKCARLAPEIKRGFLFGGVMEGVADYVKSCGADYFHPEHTRISQEEILHCKEEGVGLNLWTVNDWRAMSYLKNIGVEGIITNFPDMCAQVLNG